ncbi:hypothetical protein ACXIUT_27110 [Achromobacter denitrificans]
MGAWKERIEADNAAITAHDDALRTDPDEVRRVVEHCFGRSPEHVVGTLHRAVEAFNWLGALFECIEEANAATASRARPVSRPLPRSAPRSPAITR